MTRKYTTEHQLLALYLDVENPFWGRVGKLLKPLLRRTQHGGSAKWGDGRLTRKHIAILADVSPSTIDNWRASGPLKADTVQRVLHALDHWGRWWTPEPEQVAEWDALCRIEARFREVYSSPHFRLHQVAEILGMDTDMCRRLCDAPIYESRPLLPNAYYSPWSLLGTDGERHERQHRGLYMVWAQRGNLWLQATVAVRYVVKLDKNASFLRCKLNFPVIDSEFSLPVEERSLTSEPGESRYEPIEYDGFLSVRDHHLFFTFERRERFRSDYFYFVVGLQSLDPERHMLRGQYLTTGQDEQQSIVNGNLLLSRWVDDSPSPEGAGPKVAVEAARRRQMRNGPKVFRDGEPEWEDIERLWRKYGGDAERG